MLFAPLRGPAARPPTEAGQQAALEERGRERSGVGGISRLFGPCEHPGVTISPSLIIAKRESAKLGERRTYSGDPGTALRGRVQREERPQTPAVKKKSETGNGAEPHWPGICLGRSKPRQHQPA